MTATPVERQAARDWLLNNADPDTADLLDAIRAIYGDGIVTGAGTAAEATGTPVLASLKDLLPDSDPADIDWAKFWDDWTPGSPAAAALLDDGGFETLLDQAGITVKSIADTMLSQVGTALADGVRSGDSVTTIAKSITGMLSDPSRAQLIANTEVNRAVSTASIQTYTAAGLAQWELLTSPEACDECADIEDNNPHDLGDTDDMPPVHPSCRCAVSPVSPDGA